MRLTHIKKALFLTVITIITILSCNGVHAYSQEISIIQLAQSNEELKEENKRLSNMISQYTILVNSLRNENESLKSTNSSDKDIEIREYIGDFTLTYYCVEPYAHTCGGGGLTASGTTVTPYRSVAVDPKVIPLGTKLYIEGVGYRVAEDTGGAVKGNKLDLSVTTHKEALTLGKKSGIRVWIIEE